MTREISASTREGLAAEVTEPHLLDEDDQR
jgi:hypothetical protein